MIPGLVPHCRNWLCRWYRKKCPECDATFPNGMWQMSVVGYPMHYALEHLKIPVFRGRDD